MYAVLRMVTWEPHEKALAQDLSFPGELREHEMIGFLPVYETEEQALQEHPGATLLTVTPTNKTNA